MTDPNADPHGDIRTGLIYMLRATRDAEREVFAAFDPTDRDAVAADGGWSAGDIQAHLTAWKRRTVERLVAIREGGEEEELRTFAPGDDDLVALRAEIPALYHA